ncbi:MAG: CRISPR-associated protein Cas4 [Fimbriimonadales bacterium]|nr:CRISPR-associated protein Cas4 [Fimbriimonadales bacterium]
MDKTVQATPLVARAVLPVPSIDEDADTAQEYLMNASELLELWNEAEIVPISALEHYAYCPRQCALIHIEQVYEENVYTLRGVALHERVDEAEQLIEEGMRLEYALPLWSVRLGLSGRADVVGFLPDGTPYPIEYKSGKRKVKYHDDVQLCAQAMCLEEMLGCAVPKGAIYYYASRRRREVEFTPALRALTEQVIHQTRQMLLSGHTPPPVNDARCRDCSLLRLCMPEVIARLQAEQAVQPDRSTDRNADDHLSEAMP